MLLKSPITLQNLLQFQLQKLIQVTMTEILGFAFAHNKVDLTPKELRKILDRAFIEHPTFEEFFQSIFSNATHNFIDPK